MVGVSTQGLGGGSAETEPMAKEELGVIPCIIRFFYCAKTPKPGRGSGRRRRK